MNYFTQPITCNTIKDPHRYDVQVSDTTMMPIATSLFRQKQTFPLKK